MRLLLTADTHGPRHRLPPWLLAAAREVDIVVHAGDLCDLATLGALAETGPVYAVRGNRDEGFMLPERLLVTCEDVTIGLVHGHLGPGKGTAERALRSFTPLPDVVVFGHSHVPWNATGVAGQLLFNPGSPTERRQQPHRTMGVLELAVGQVVRATIEIVDP